MIVEVYSKPGCGQCIQTLRMLDKEPTLTVHVVDITEDPKALDYVKSQGFSAAPIVKTSDGDMWQGHNTQLVKGLIDRSQKIG